MPAVAHRAGYQIVFCLAARPANPYIRFMASHTKITLQVDGMHCAGCAAGIEKGVRRLTGVADCQVNFAMRSAAIAFDPAVVGQDSIARTISDLGYHAHEGRPDVLEASRRDTAQARRRFQISLVLAVPLMLLAMWPMYFDGPLISALVDGVAQAVLALLLLAGPGRPIIIDALLQARHGRANMNSLIALGTLTAFGWSLYVLITVSRSGGVGAAEYFFESSGMIIALILLGRYLEARARGRAGEAIGGLVKLQPPTTTVILQDVETAIETAAVTPGMILLVRPGERVPVDGVVLDGHPAIDESMVTGESMPADKSPGGEVIGGSLNGHKAFRMRATRGSQEGFLADMVRLVSEAQSRKAPVQHLADRVAAVFVPIVLVIALLTAALWYWLDPGSPMLIKSVVSVLIIACPCALGLATPTAILAGTGRAAREGLIIRGGDVLEKLTRIDTVLVDKTGTLTHGRLDVAEVEVFGEMSRMELVRLAGSAEIASEHPVAAAIVRHMRLNQIEPTAVREVEAMPGLGLRGIWSDHQLLIGNLALMKSIEVDLGEALPAATRHMEEGRTVVLVALDNRAIGLLALTDRLRSEARDAIAWLTKHLGQVVLISGDTYQTTRGVAQSLKIERFESEIRPRQKAAVVEAYRKAGFRPAMVGDGINDAPALAAADIGIAIGSGTDVAGQAADCILIRSDLMALPQLFKIGKATMRSIKQNLFWAFFYNVAAIPIAAGALWPVAGITLSPMIAAAAMAFSSVFVVTNSLRLSRVDLG
ncbi:MAG: heavy metal translocating P-type ATPase [bacterium]